MQKRTMLYSDVVIIGGGLSGGGMGCQLQWQLQLTDYILCLAVQKGNIAIALQILAEDNVKINVAGRDGRTALHSATLMGNIPIIAVLLAKDDLDPNLLDEEKWASLTYAASQGDSRMVELFLGRADIKVNVQGAPPLFHAAIEGHLEVLRRLLSFDTININQTYRGDSPLCAASAMGHLEVTKLLLRHTTSPHIYFKTYMGRTALSLAASGGHSHIVALLLEEKGLDVSAADTCKETALCHAARNGHE
jgi:ankyrin repeat protein